MSIMINNLRKITTVPTLVEQIQLVVDVGIFFYDLHIRKRL